MEPWGLWLESSAKHSPLMQLSMYSYKYISYLYRGDTHLWENTTMLTQEHPHHPYLTPIWVLLPMLPRLFLPLAEPLNA